MYYGYGYEPNIQMTTVNLLLPIPKSNVNPLKISNQNSTPYSISAIPKERKFKILLCKNQPELHRHMADFFDCGFSLLYDLQNITYERRLPSTHPWVITTIYSYHPKTSIHILFV